MATLGETIQELATLAGVDLSTNEELAATLAQQTAVLPDEVVSTLKTNLITRDIARNDLSVKQHFRKQLLSEVDNHLLSELKKEGFSDEELADLHKIIGDGSTLKKITTGLNKLKAAKSKKPEVITQTTDVDKSKAHDANLELVRKVEELQKLLELKEQEKEKAIQDYIEEQKKLEAKRNFEAALNNKLLSRPTIIEGTPEMKTAVLNSLVSLKLKEINGKAILTENGIEIVNKKDETMPVLSPTNQKYTIDMVIDMAIKDAKLAPTVVPTQTAPQAIPVTNANRKSYSERNAELHAKLSEARR
jgi:hypothetical protein